MTEQKDGVKLPTIRELHTDIDKFEKTDALNFLCNQQPKKDWIRENKYAGNSKYIPVGIIETMLQKIFKEFRIEVLREGVMFNSVYVTVRLHLNSPVTGQPLFYDGVGAVQLQTKQGASPADLAMINNNAVMMALPMAKSYALKDAAEHIGKLFGRDLNRKDVLEYTPEKSISDKAEDKERNRILDHIKSLKDIADLELFMASAPEYKTECINRINELKNGK